MFIPGQKNTGGTPSHSAVHFLSSSVRAVFAAGRLGCEGRGSLKPKLVGCRVVERVGVTVDLLRRPHRGDWIVRDEAAVGGVVFASAEVGQRGQVLLTVEVAASGGARFGGLCREGCRTGLGGARWCRGRGSLRC